MGLFCKIQTKLIKFNLAAVVHLVIVISVPLFVYCHWCAMCLIGCKVSHLISEVSSWRVRTY